MKKHVKTLLLFFFSITIASIFNSCENENFESISQESVINQEQEWVEIELNGHLVTVLKVGNEYRLGDIIIPIDTSISSKSVGRVSNRWPNNTITYVLDPSVSSSIVEDAIEHWELFTNLRFVEKSFTGSYEDVKGSLLFYEGSGCSAGVGYYGEDTEHNVSVGSGCGVEETIHEIGHAAGLWHEQSRNDRDQYLEVHWENISSGSEYNFQTYVERNTDGSEYTEFDFNSVMLYDSYAFSVNGQPTLTKSNGSTFTRQSENLSYLDVQGLEIMYPQIGSNKKISIEKYGTFVSSENGGDITANRDEVGTWEEFEIVPYGDGYVYLKGNNGKYLSEGSGDYLRFDQDAIENATKLYLYRSGGGTYGIQSANSGMYLSREYGTDKLIFGENYLNGESAFQIALIESNTIINISDVIALLGSNGEYVCSENGTKAMNCNRPEIGAWEQFEVVDAGDGLIALKGSNGEYVCSENGTKAMNCNRPEIGAWEKFELISLGGDSYALKGNNGKYVSSENGDGSMTCDTDEITSSEEFTIIKL
ncbi:M12 family metallopeptidase [Aquimarina pacifica]|uniref:M12 family metallopeptidase n=1 Tax=Aquimarina pacifica TaxID=1296415 RepID=UPI00046FD351|nr:M12 family metallopeptidase [Aquimarina pacifica]